jgi:predicted nucleic acid-binding protein
LTVFVDSSVWFASIVAKDRDNARAKAVLLGDPDRVTSDHVVVETWLLLKNRYRREAAEQFWDRIRLGAARIELVTLVDIDTAWAIGEAFPDQDFSIVDRTSFSVMERLGIMRAASFDDHFAIYRFGRNRDRAFEIVA